MSVGVQHENDDPCTREASKTNPASSKGQPVPLLKLKTNTPIDLQSTPEDPKSPRQGVPYTPRELASKAVCNAKKENGEARWLSMTPDERRLAVEAASSVLRNEEMRLKSENATIASQKEKVARDKRMVEARRRIEKEADGSESDDEVTAPDLVTDNCTYMPRRRLSRSLSGMYVQLFADP